MICYLFAAICFEKNIFNLYVVMNAFKLYVLECSDSYSCIRLKFLIIISLNALVSG